ncbi:MAG: penicillin acylase family protein [Actinomycetota bacterium]|nr:penicillin acylase family protein [Actinomycetota bacterium]
MLGAGRAVRFTVALVAVAMLFAACDSGDDDNDDNDDADDAESTEETAASDSYSATIRRTSYGVPHITADNLGSAAFGQGFAMTEDHGCDLIDQVVKVRSERSKYFGAGDDDVNLNSDLALLSIGLYDKAEAGYEQLTGDSKEIVDGYTAGYNAFLDQRGALTGWCAGEAWVTPITPVDLLAHLKELLLLASGRQFYDFIATAEPPGADATTETTIEGDAAALESAFRSLAPNVASNGWAIGSERSEANAMLLANPHFPWEGELRLWESQLTVPGELNVYGASLLGAPGVLIGFNDAVAWTHTVSAGNRFTVYRLGLEPGVPTSYRYDDEIREMESAEYTVAVAQDDGSTTDVSRTLYRSHYGPIINFPGLGWSDEVTLSYRDANIDNDVFLDQFLGMDRATSLDEFKAAHETFNGIPWVNTISVGADGTAWYADTAATPNLSQAAIDGWLAALDSDPVTEIAYQNQAVLLDGSDSTNEWVDAPGARSSGLVPFVDQPQLERDDYVFNANDSYWLSNPDELLTGFSPMHGREETARTMRTRMNVRALEEGPGDDGKFTLEELQAAAFSNRALTAELLRAAVVADVCPGATDLVDACASLAAWDGRFDLDRAGAPLWGLFVEGYEFSDLFGPGPLFSDEFDPADPVNTPSVPAFATDPAARDTALASLRQAVADLAAAGFVPGATLGEVQFAPRGDQRIPMHGGSGDFFGITNAIGFGRFSSSTEPAFEPAERVREGSSLRADGWPVNSGSSFVMTMEFGADGPRAQAFLTYGQSGDVSSPNFSDQTQLFSDKNWRDILFTDEQIEADPDVNTYEVTAPRGS